MQQCPSCGREGCVGWDPDLTAARCAWTDCNWVGPLAELAAFLGVDVAIRAEMLGEEDSPDEYLDGPA